MEISFCGIVCGGRDILAIQMKKEKKKKKLAFECLYTSF